MRPFGSPYCPAALLPGRSATSMRQGFISQVWATALVAAHAVKERPQRNQSNKHQEQHSSCSTSDDRLWTQQAGNENQLRYQAQSASLPSFRVSLRIKHARLFSGSAARLSGEPDYLIYCFDLAPCLTLARCNLLCSTKGCCLVLARSAFHVGNLPSQSLKKAATFYRRQGALCRCRYPQIATHNKAASNLAMLVEGNNAESWLVSAGLSTVRSNVVRSNKRPPKLGS